MEYVTDVVSFASDPEGFYTAESDCLIRQVGGELYRFDYTAGQSEYRDYLIAVESIMEKQKVVLSSIGEMDVVYMLRVQLERMENAPLPSLREYAMLYGIDEGSIAECVGYLAIDTSVSADEVTVMVMKDEESAIAAEEACRNRMADQIAACANYCPDQVPRLEKAVILRRGSTVLLAAANPERLPKALEELGLN